LTGPILWGRHIAPDDGRIDICIVRARNLRDLLLVGWDMVVPGQPRQDRNLRYLEARHSVLVMADDPLPVQGDGEELGHTPVEVTLRPEAVRVLVPQHEGRPSVVELLRNRERPAVLNGILSRGRE
ncbi:MAG: hypothetical protein R3300_17205, partial [Candidatus Promineifilaceae bacterium]|nr:hypothetical protein [Candidatus Promineifilaceae bacterium]